LRGRSEIFCSKSNKEVVLYKVIVEKPNPWTRPDRRIPPLYETRDSFLYEADAPTLDANELMSRPIARPDSADSLVIRRFSQTPLAPKLLSDRSLPYPKAAHDTLVHRVEAMADHTGLNELYLTAIMHEINQEHDRRIRGNTEAAMRLQAEIADRTLNEDDATLIWKARTGDADLGETAELLLRYPVMQSIEAAKHTQPLDPEAFNKMIMHVWRGFTDISSKVSEPSKVRPEWYDFPDDRRDLRPIPTIDESQSEYVRGLQSMIRASKENIAEVQRGDVKIQLVYKRTKILIHPDQYLENSVPNIVTSGDRTANVQDIGFACYWRVIENAQ
jgi:hypothetical protein